MEFGRRARIRVLLGSVLLFGGPSAAAQRRLPPIDLTPLLEPGQRIRVWSWEPAPVLPRPRPVLREVRIAGTLLVYDPPDSLRVRRTGPLAAFSATREPTIYWSSVSRINVPNGRNVLGGAAGGLAGAFGVALLAGLAERAFGCQYGDSCGNAFTYTARIAVVTVPAGAVVGAFSTRWKRVY